MSISMNTIETDASTTRILIVDDQNLIRETIQVYLEKEVDLKVVGYAEDGAKALKQIEQLTPDVVILDLEMPGMDGLSTIQAIRDRFSATKILVLSSHDERENIDRAIEAGAKGYLTKGTPARELASAVRSVSQGYFQLGPGLIEKLVISLSNSEQKNSITLEEKLVIALKKFKQDTNQQLDKLVKTKFIESNRNLEYELKSQLNNFKRNQNELYDYARKIEFKLYLFLTFQVIFMLGLAIYIVLVL